MLKFNLAFIIFLIVAQILQLYQCLICDLVFFYLVYVNPENQTPQCLHLGTRFL